ncbi:hypothetical protein N9K29_03615 [Candidatus Pelagibacter sp.]|nr:hypothetical protein [Candidatus Pelagibacter sp.]
MIKKLTKILSIILFIVILAGLYLSFIGVKTDKFNESITSRIFKINKEINLSLKDIKFLLNPFNFTVNITTKDPTIFLSDGELKIRSIKTNVSLKALILDEFSLDELQILTKRIRLNDAVLLARTFKNSTQLFLLDKVIEGGFLEANIKLKFDGDGNVKENYQINGFIKNAKLNFLNQLNANNLNVNFNISKNEYSLTEINTKINNVQFSSPLIEVNKKKNLFFITGKIFTEEKNFSRDQLGNSFGTFLNNPNIEKVRFSSENDISFKVSKNLKFNDLKIKSKINLDQLIVKNNFVNLKPFLPNLDEFISFENHKIIIDYKKDKIDIKGNGEILIKDKRDSINYKVVKNNGNYTFDTKVNLKNNKLLINFLDYEKKKDLDSLILINGYVQNNNLINFNSISLIEKNNTISFRNLNLSKDFKIINIDNFDFNYLNNKKIKNKLSLKKNNLNYAIEGESFDATNLINQIMNSDDSNFSLFNDFNSKITIKINKTYIDEVNFINNLSGVLNFKNNKINDLDLKSTFPNNKKISFSIKTNEKQEKITKLSTDYPKPLVKRYDFIKGFEEGFLVFQSTKKNTTSDSLLTIDNFKVKEVPGFAKLLSLASLQGIADLLTGEGIRFTDLEMKFSNKKGLTTINEMYAIGPAVSILMDGYVESKGLISLRGTMVPATTINRSIASIPLLGNILIGKKTGEGVFGVSFKIKGTPKKLKTTVNPVKTLTPRFITRTLEKIKKN